MSDPQDMLQDLFDKQMSLNKRIGVNPPEMNEEEQVQWILNYTRAASQEMAELIDSVPWKWWAKYQEFDVQNAKVEVVDLFHFLISLAQVLGMDAKDVHDLYNQKNKLNFKRQDDGYTVKDENDNRDLG
ncbi:dUTPase [Kiritimatiellota bacterium B12222]|nr:dUTPase [Kiritimatiellota bacterium B12222]